MVPIQAWLSEASQFSRRYGRPLVTLSYAQSLDGCISTRRGIPTSISGPQALRLTHQLRAAHDAILVGIGTVLADDPRLNVRLVEGKNPQPVILDSHLRMPVDARLMQGDLPPWIATAQPALPPPDEFPNRNPKAAALQERGAQLLPLPVDNRGGLSLYALLQTLARRGITSLMVEGGAQVISGFLLQNLVDQVVLTIAPILLGGLPAVERSPEQEPYPGGQPVLARLREIGYDRLGQDLIVWGKLR